MKLVRRVRTETGWQVAIEMPGALTNGEAATKLLHFTREELLGLDGDGVLALIRRELETDPFETILGADLSKVAPAPPRRSLDEKLSEIAGKLDTKGAADDRSGRA